MEPLWSPVVATGGNQSQIWDAREPQEQAKTVAAGCDQLPIAAHGKERVCHRLPPVAEVPLSVKEGVDSYLARRGGAYFLLQSGHGHWSQPQPVHASQIMRRVYRAASQAALR